MQRVTEAWEQTNRDNFTRPANVTLSMTLADGRKPIVSGSRLISFNYNKAGDCLSGILTQDTITFTFDNSDGRFNYDPENDVYQYSQVSIICGFMNVEYSAYDGIDGGIYYISNTESYGGKTTFTAKTILGFMSAKYLVNDESSIEETGANIVESVINQAENEKGVPLNRINVVYDDSLNEYTLRIERADNYSLAEVLQLIANAYQCILYVDRAGTIHIDKLGDVSENYVLSGKISYEFPKVKLAEKIGDINLYYNHGSAHATNAESEEGGELTVTNPIMRDGYQALSLARYIMNFQASSRKRITGNFRADPRIDLFDIIVIPAGDKACVCAITKINFTFNGAWRGTFEAVEVSTARLDLRICDLEMLTLGQLESIPIEQLQPNTVSVDDGDYIATADGKLMLWEE